MKAITWTKPAASGNDGSMDMAFLDKAHIDDEEWIDTRLDAVTDLWCQASRDEAPGFEPDLDAAMASIISLVTGPAGLVLTHEDGETGAIVGYLTAQLVYDPAVSQTTIVFMAAYVLPEYQGNGIGDWLTSRALDWGRLMGAERWTTQGTWMEKYIERHGIKALTTSTVCSGLMPQELN